MFVLVLLTVGAICRCGWLLMVASVAAIRVGGAGASVTYHVEQVATDRHDYYACHGEAPGTWRGAFAEHLGLSGDVTAEAFRAVLDGADPGTGEALKPQPNRRVAAWDITFSPPKSISALWAIAPDDARRHVREAQAAAVDAAVGYLTVHACVARLGRDGVDRRTDHSLGSCEQSSRTAAHARAIRSCTPTPSSPTSSKPPTADVRRSTAG
jgi:hypothetical protein